MTKPHLLDDVPRLPEGQSLAPAEFFAFSLGRIELEVGFAGGAFLLERVRSCEDALLVGLEWRKSQVRATRDRLQRSDREHRVRVFREDAREAIPRFQPSCLDAIYLHFPDPWWKARHHKRRLSNSAFLQQFARVLKPGGELFIQSDVQTQIEDYERVVSSISDLRSWGSEPGSARLLDNPYAARSTRERSAIADGLPILRLRYRKA